MIHPDEVYALARELAYEDGTKAIRAARQLGYVPVKELHDLLGEVREAWAFGLANGYIRPIATPAAVKESA